MKSNLILAIYGIACLFAGFILGYDKSFIGILIEFIIVLGYWIFLYLRDAKLGVNE
jgi:hypothetical protein